MAALIAGVCAMVAWQFVGAMWQSIQIAFAEEQTEIFTEMVVKANEALKRDPPNVKAAVGYLRYTYNYYPSGTKQTIGSPLDRIVERSRTLAELRIIEMLRDVADVDHGEDVEDWIRNLHNLDDSEGVD